MRLNRSLRFQNTIFDIFVLDLDIDWLAQVKARRCSLNKLNVEIWWDASLLFLMEKFKTIVLESRVQLTQIFYIILFVKFENFWLILILLFKLDIYLFNVRRNAWREVVLKYFIRSKCITFFIGYKYSVWMTTESPLSLYFFLISILTYHLKFYLS